MAAAGLFLSIWEVREAMAQQGALGDEREKKKKKPSLSGTVCAVKSKMLNSPFLTRTSAAAAAAAAGDRPRLSCFNLRFPHGSFYLFFLRPRG